MACHIMDAAYWTLDLGYPTHIEAEPTPLFKETAPAGARISYTFAAKSKRPEVKVVWRDGSLYPPRPAEVADDLAWPFDKGGGQLWIGSDGKLTAGTYGDDPKLLTPTKQGVASGDPPPPPPVPPGAAAQVPALTRRLRRVDRGVQGRVACGLDVRRACGRADFDGAARVSRGAVRPGAGGEPGERAGDEPERSGGVHPPALPVGVELVADVDSRSVTRRRGPG